MSYISQPQHLGHLLRNIRHSISLTRANMADILGVTERTIQNYESGQSRLTIENWVRCISILDRYIKNEKKQDILEKEVLPEKVSEIVKNLLNSH